MIRWLRYLLLLSLLCAPIHSADHVPGMGKTGEVIAPTVRYVVRDSDTGGAPGELRTAIDQAHPGDTITFHPQMHGRTITLNPKLGTIDLKLIRLTIEATDCDITLSGGGKCRIFAIRSGTQTINGLHLTAGVANDPDGGGAILIEKGAKVRIANAKFTHNRASQGGAIANNGELALMGGSSFIDNQAIRGGAILNQGKMR